MASTLPVGRHVWLLEPPEGLNMPVILNFEYRCVCVLKKKQSIFLRNPRIFPFSKQCFPILYSWKLSQYYLAWCCRTILSVHTLSLIAQWSLLISLLAYMLCKTKYAKAVLLDTNGYASVRSRLQFYLLLSSSSCTVLMLRVKRHADSEDAASGHLLLLPWYAV
jgi:hypothetical protein